MVSKQPLQILNGFWGDHHHWMFFGGLTIAINGFSIFFFILLPSLLMVFDGSGPLVKRCDGFDGSLWSTSNLSDLTVICLCLYVYLLFLQINICTFFLSSSSTLSCFLSLSKPTPSRWTSTRPSLDITLLFFQENRLTLNSVQFLWRLFMTSRCWTTRHL